MRKLFSILTDSTLIWSRNFTLIYVFLMALLLLQGFIPQNIKPVLETRWFLLAGILLLLFAAMMSGFYGMVALACERFLGKPRDQALREASPVDAITLFQGFFPGIARYLLPVTGGYLIHIGMGVLLVLPMWPLLTRYMPMMRQMVVHSVEEQLNMISIMSEAQRHDLATLNALMIGAIVTYILFSTLSTLWPAFVVYYGNNPFKACFRSILQFFKDPLTLIGLIAVIFTVGTVLGMLYLVGVGVGNFFTNLLVTLLFLFGRIFINIMVFVYVYQTVGKPVVIPEVSEPAKSNDAEDNW